MFIELLIAAVLYSAMAGLAVLAHNNSRWTNTYAVAMAVASVLAVMVASTI